MPHNRGPKITSDWQSAAQSPNAEFYPWIATAFLNNIYANPDLK